MRVFSQTKQLNIYNSNSTATTEYLSTSTGNTKNNLYTINYKLIAILGAGILLFLIIIRICLVFGKSSRSSTNSLTTRRTGAIRPQIAIIEQNAFKPDLPPAYTEAIANIDNDESKLPSYNELHNEQETRKNITTQM